MSGGRSRFLDCASRARNDRKAGSGKLTAESPWPNRALAHNAIALPLDILRETGLNEEQARIPWRRAAVRLVVPLQGGYRQLTVQVVPKADPGTIARRGVV